MEKENKEKNIKKNVKKPSSKKTLNETVKVSKKIVKKEEIASDKQECRFCHNIFDKGLRICPNCYRKQKNNKLIIFLIVFASVFIAFVGICSYLDENIFNPVSETEYKSECKFVSYEDLIRVPKTYRGEKVSIIGIIDSVYGYDEGLGNNMTIEINANLFDDDSIQRVIVTFKDRKYEQGFVAGDIIRVYGKYSSINGNEPTIDAKYIAFTN